jgi:cobalt-zinc-cadmium resistance protein CzcA
MTGRAGRRRLATVSRVLLEGIVLVVIILFLFLGDLRSAGRHRDMILTPALTFW